MSPGHGDSTGVSLPLNVTVFRDQNRMNSTTLIALFRRDPERWKQPFSFCLCEIQVRALVMCDISTKMCDLAWAKDLSTNAVSLSSTGETDMRTISHLKPTLVNCIQTLVFAIHGRKLLGRIGRGNDTCALNILACLTSIWIPFLNLKFIGFLQIDAFHLFYCYLLCNHSWHAFIHEMMHVT